MSLIAECIVSFRAGECRFFQLLSRPLILPTILCGFLSLYFSSSPSFSPLGNNRFTACPCGSLSPAHTHFLSICHYIFLPLHLSLGPSIDCDCQWDSVCARVCVFQAHYLMTSCKLLRCQAFLSLNVLCYSCPCLLSCMHFKNLTLFHQATENFFTCGHLEFMYFDANRYFIQQWGK